MTAPTYLSDDDDDLAPPAEQPPAMIRILVQPADDGRVDIWHEHDAPIHVECGDWSVTMGPDVIATVDPFNRDAPRVRNARA